MASIVYKKRAYGGNTSIADANHVIADNGSGTNESLQNLLIKILGNFATIQSSTTASKAYNAGEYFILNSYLYKVKTAIAAGGTINVGVGGNAVQTTVEAEIQTTVPEELSKILPTVVDEQIDNKFGDDIGDNVTSWLNEHVTPSGSAVVVDDTLSIQGAAADAKKTGDEISGLKEEFSDNNSSAKKTILDDGYLHLPHLYTQGSINASGVENNTGAWLKSVDYIPVSAGDVIKYTGATKDGNNIALSRYIIYYDSSKIFISRNAFTSVTIPSGTAYVRINVGYGSSTGVTAPPDADLIDAIFPKCYLRDNYWTSTETEKFIDRHMYGSEPTVTWITGKTLGTDGNIANNAEYMTCDFIQSGDAVTVEFDLSSDDVEPPAYICRYVDTDYTTLIGEREKLLSHTAFTDKGKYFRIAVKTLDQTRVTLTVIGAETTKGKMVAFGDSITEGTWNNSGGSSGGRYAHCYIQTMADSCRYSLVNCGKAGTGMMAKVSNKSLKELVDDNSAALADADLVTIAYGVNDYIGNKPVGDLTDAVDAETCAGKLKYALSTMTGNGVEGSGTAPYARVVLLSPLNARRAYSDALSGSPIYANNWYLGLANNAGYTLQDYKDMIKAVGDYYGVEVIDLNEIGPINRGNLRNLLGDGLHPTKAGHVKIGQALASYFK